MIDAEPLTYRELIRTIGWGAGPLLPDEIPIHKSVYNYEDVYTQGFVDEVRASLPKSIKDNISAIEKIMGWKLNLKVMDEGILHKPSNELTEFKSFDFNARKGSKEVEVYHGSSNIALGFPTSECSPGYARGNYVVFSNHPIKSEKLSQYSVFEYADLLNNVDLIYNVVCYSHNVCDELLPSQLIFIGFIKELNNIGLEWLQ